MAQDDVAAFEADLDALETSLGDAGAVAAAFSDEVRRMQSALAETSMDAAALSRGMSRGLRSALDGLVFGGDKASDALRGVAESLANTVYSTAIRPVTDHFGGMLGSVIGGLFADGAAFSQGRVMPFANGGVVSGATAFPMRGGVGVMGEAGPEAILPLSRGADGRLGVRADAGRGPVQVVMNIQTPDAESFQRSRSQVARQMQRALALGQRNG